MLQDYITKFTTEKLDVKPKIKKIIVRSNLNNKKFTNIYKSKDNKMQKELLERYNIFKYMLLQTPKIIKAKKSVANWNVRKGMDTGVMVTIRNEENWREILLNIYPNIVEKKFSYKNMKTSEMGLGSIGMFNNIEGKNLEKIGIGINIETTGTNKYKHKFILNYNKYKVLWVSLMAKRLVLI